MILLFTTVTQKIYMSTTTIFFTTLNELHKKEETTFTIYIELSRTVSERVVFVGSGEIRSLSTIHTWSNVSFAILGNRDNKLIVVKYMYRDYPYTHDPTVPHSLSLLKF